MTVTWFRRALLPLACALLSLLAACGGTIESALTPSRFFVVGDAFSDLGQTGTRYTVNGDAGRSNWTEEVAARYGQTLSTSTAGGLSYARAHARVSHPVDAVGGGAASIQAQVDALLAAHTLGVNDVVLIQGGISDIIAEMAASADTATRIAHVKQAGRDMGQQVRRLVAAGAKQMVMVGAYNLGQSPWAIGTGQRDLLRDLSAAFNEALLVSVEDLGANVLYVDAALYFNLVTAVPTAYGLVDTGNLLSTSAPVIPVMVCTTVDAGVGIGTGVGQINSSLCNTSTIASGIDYNTRLFADRVYLTPVGQRLFGDFAFGKLKARW